MTFSSGLWEQMLGRVNRGRLVHAARARKLRRRGETVRYYDRGPCGKVRYRWFKKADLLDHVTTMLTPPNSRFWTLDEVRYAGEQARPRRRIETGESK